MIAFIIVSFNTRELLRACLQSIQRYEPDSEVIVVDNGSRDGSVTMVRDEFPIHRLFASEKNLGFAAANNLGLSAATRPYAVLLNSDTELLDDSISRCVLRMVREPSLGAVHPSLRGADGNPQECVHREPSLRSSLRKALRLRVSDESSAQWLAGTALVLRKQALDQVGRLNDDFFMYWEDADLSARLRAAGWGLAHEPRAIVKHYGGGSGGGPDAARRADLYAWYCWGKHRWFILNRPRRESLFIWTLDAIDVARKYARGLLYVSRRRAEWSHAHTTVHVLAWILTGRRPPLPFVQESSC